MYDKNKDILGWYKFQCPYCGVKFMAKPQAYLHINMMHKNKLRQMQKAYVREQANQFFSKEKKYEMKK